MKVLGFLLLSIFTMSITACSSSSSSSGNGGGNDTVLDEASLRTYQTTCVTKTYQTYKYQDGGFDYALYVTTKNATKNVKKSVNKKVQQSDVVGTADISIYKVDANGSNQVLSNSYSYDYQTQQTVNFEDLDKDTSKETGVVNMTKTGKNGFQFSDENGKKSPTRKQSWTYELISKYTSGAWVDLSSKVNGKPDPALYYTQTSINNNTTSQTSSLMVSYTEQLPDMQIETTKEETNCTSSDITTKNMN